MNVLRLCITADTIMESLKQTGVFPAEFYCLSLCEMTYKIN